MRERNLRSGVNWQGASKQKIKGVTEELREFSYDMNNKRK
jgi:hypothetical protein